MGESERKEMKEGKRERERRRKVGEREKEKNERKGRKEGRRKEERNFAYILFSYCSCPMCRNSSLTLYT